MAEGRTARPPGLCSPPQALPLTAKCRDRQRSGSHVAGQNQGGRRGKSRESCPAAWPPVSPARPCDRPLLIPFLVSEEMKTQSSILK